MTGHGAGPGGSHEGREGIRLPSRKTARRMQERQRNRRGRGTTPKDHRRRSWRNKAHYYYRTTTNTKIFKSHHLNHKKEELEEQGALLLQNDDQYLNVPPPPPLWPSPDHNHSRRNQRGDDGTGRTNAPLPGRAGKEPSFGREATRQARTVPWLQGWGMYLAAIVFFSVGACTSWPGCVLGLGPVPSSQAVF
ncbi:unnamed protein product [Calypogeia fissa]